MVEDHIRDVLQQRMRTCWRMPTETEQNRGFSVTVVFALREDGSLDGRPSVTSPSSYTFDTEMRDAVTEALRAVRVCAPYPFASDPVTAEHYELWREIEMAFTPP